MSFLTILFALLGFAVDFQPNTTPAPQTEVGGVIIVDGLEGDAQAGQGGATAGGSGQGGAQTEVGGYIIVDG